MFYKIAIIMFLLLGLFFIGKGITGLVIAETCCSPAEDCDYESMCDIYKEKQAPTDIINVVGGLSFLFASWIVYKQDKK